MNSTFQHQHLVVKGRMKPEYESLLTADALTFIEQLLETFCPKHKELLRNRSLKQNALHRGALPDFLPETAHIRDSHWKIAPIPPLLQSRCVEITGPATAKMIINALNAPVDVFMADLEDSLSPTWDNIIEGQLHLKNAILGTLQYTSPENKVYRLNPKTATLMARVRGLHLFEKHILYQNEPIPGCLLDFGLYCFHNAKNLLQQGSGPYFYIPKLENHLEARWWNEVFETAEKILSLPQKSIKATVLIETILAAFEMDEILYELKDHIVGLNCGRWDYIFSFIKKFHQNPNKILPDRTEITMDKHFLASYCKLLIQTCHKRGAFAMGGMSAFIPVKSDAALNEAAFQKVSADKTREAHLGHDGTWIAHPGLAKTARDAFSKVMTGENQLNCLRSEDVVSAADLLEVPAGKITILGFCNNIKVAIQYLAAWLSGNGCVPLYNLMEDAATAEICRSQLWQWVHHKAKFEDNTSITLALFKKMLQQEYHQLKAELSEALFNQGHYEEASKLLEKMVSSDTFIEFLTLPAYEMLTE